MNRHYCTGQIQLPLLLYANRQKVTYWHHFIAKMEAKVKLIYPI